MQWENIYAVLKNNNTFSSPHVGIREQFTHYSFSLKGTVFYTSGRQSLVLQHSRTAPFVGQTMVMCAINLFKFGPLNKKKSPPVESLLSVLHYLQFTKPWYN